MTTPSEAEMAADDHNEFEESPDTIPFEPDAVRDHIDACIRNWRQARRQAIESGGDIDLAEHYIDAFQSMRTSLFGETLPMDKERVQRTLTIRVLRNGKQVSGIRSALLDNLSQAVVAEWREADAHYVVEGTIQP